MGRKIRVFFENISSHILLRSLPELKTFSDIKDVNLFKDLIYHLSNKYGVEIHSYIIDDNIFEFLATPKNVDSIPKFLQNLSRNYVLYFNNKYNRRGTVWSGRYKSSLVQDKFVFDVMKYIENQKFVYNCNSIYKNLYNKSDKIVTPHNLYKNLAYSSSLRCEKYKRVFDKALDENLKSFIKNSLEKQSITGDYNFIKKIEKALGITLVSKKRGRPKKKQEKKMYKKLVVLDKEKHKNLKVNPMENLDFAKDLKFVPISINESKLVSALFPIVFTADEEPSLIALVSLGGDNLAINSEGKWITNYIPTYIRRYPFSLAKISEDKAQKVVLIDEESPLLSTVSGSALFNENGEQSEVLVHAINFLNEFDKQIETTKAVAKILNDANILEEREIAIGEGDEKKVLVKGFRVVNKEKLNELSDDVLANWYRRGILSFIDIHLNSLENINNLFKILQTRQS